MQHQPQEGNVKVKVTAILEIAVFTFILQHFYGIRNMVAPTTVTAGTSQGVNICVFIMHYICILLVLSQKKGINFLS